MSSEAALEYLRTNLEVARAAHGAARLNERYRLYLQGRIDMGAEAIEAVKRGAA